MKTKKLTLSVLLLASLSSVTSASALTNAFTYQGRLTDNGGTASGNYDLRVSLYATEISGSPIAVLTNANVAVSSGLFTTTLDFGAAAFTGPARWLEIGVRTNGSSGDFTTLTPRQPITPTPYAIHASAFAGPVVDTQLSPNISRLNANQMFTGTVAFNPLSGPPFTVDSSVKVANLNAHLLDGLELSTFLLKTQQCVRSIASLKALAPGVVPCVLVLGYYAPGDGGGGIFYWDASTAEADNKGTIIATVPIRPTGRWKRMVKGPLSVRFFGATGDGVSDDGPAIQSTIHWAASGFGSGIVSVPRGTYKLTNQIVLEDNTSIPANGLIIEGEGPASFLAFDHKLRDGQGIAINGKGTSQITIRNLRLGALPGGVGYNRGLVFDTGSNITIRDNDLSGAVLGGFGYPSAIYLSGDVEDVWILDNYFHDNGVDDRNSFHILVNPDMDWRGAKRVHIRDNRCMPGPEAGAPQLGRPRPTVGIGIFNGTYVEIVGNYVEGIKFATGGPFGDRANGYGIMLYRTTNGTSHHHVVQANMVKDTGGAGIYVQSSPYTAVIGNVIEDVAKDQYAGSLAIGGIGFNQGPGSIIGNVIRNVGVGNTNGVLPFGIAIQTCVNSPGNTNCDVCDGVLRGITVSGNTIENTANYGIALETAPFSTADNSTIIGNTLVNTRGGIGTIGGAPIAGLTIVGNSIIRGTTNSLSRDSAVGIFLEAVSHSTISQNVLANAGGQGVVLYTGSSRNVVNGNIVRDSGQYQTNAYPGIQVVGTNNIVIGNQSYNTGTNGLGQNYGILETGGSNDLLDNNVVGNLETTPVGILSVGANTTRSQNRLAADKSQGSCPLSAGQCHVATREVQPGDKIQVTRLSFNGTPGHLSVVNLVAGSFNIVSSEGGDSSEVFWRIIH